MLAAVAADVDEDELTGDEDEADDFCCCDRLPPLNSFLNISPMLRVERDLADALAAGEKNVFVVVVAD